MSIPVWRPLFAPCDESDSDDIGTLDPRFALPPVLGRSQALASADLKICENAVWPLIDKLQRASAASACGSAEESHPANR